MSVLVGPDCKTYTFRVKLARDPVLVTPLDRGTGLISYQRRDGSLVHTLNDAEGLARKLNQLGIVLK